MRTAKEWRCVHTHTPQSRRCSSRQWEVCTSHSRTRNFHEHDNSERRRGVQQSGSNVATRGVERDATSSRSVAAEYPWIDCPTVIIGVHKMPRRRLLVPQVDDAPPLAPLAAIDIACTTEAQHKNLDEVMINHFWRVVGAMDVRSEVGQTLAGRSRLRCGGW